MAACRYTCAELEAMRFIIYQLLVRNVGGRIFPASASDMEDQLRTYMLAGLTSRDLLRHLRVKRMIEPQ